MQGTHGHLSAEQKQTAFRLRREGWRLIDIAREIGCTAPMVGLMVRAGKHLDADPFGWEPRRGCLTIRDREQILLGINAQETMSAIARSLGRSPSTITREVKANGGRDRYSAWQAHRRARDQARRPKPCKLRAGRLRDEVAVRLEQLWSPDEISQRLILDFPDDPEMRVSHETIYKSLFIQGRKELRSELTRCLRTGRATRRARGRSAKAPTISGMVNISERPAEADDRAVHGHWEGDLIIGANNQSAIGTLVERTSRFTIVFALPDGYSADKVRDAAVAAMADLPELMRRSLTWDQGTEMAHHSQFSIATGIPVFFCDPRSPWQRPTSENTNGLLRQYFPKGTDLTQYSTDELQHAVDSLNSRPREMLDFKTPAEKYAQLVAMTD